MAAITLKNIPDELYERLREAASLHHRSINGEVIACIEQSLVSRRVSADEVLARARQLRAKTADHPITDSELAEAKAAGRP